MKSIVILTSAKNNGFSKGLLWNRNLVDFNYFETHSFQEIYQLSLKNELDVVIINQRMAPNEEQHVIRYLNQKNASTILIPYQQSISNQIKKRMDRILKEKIKPR